jgi:chemotaxis protein MotA|uniref:Flagellar motor protein n=1 Tax=Thermomicrobium roseum TaxID=500 RepID=A0A7C2B7G6_THERO
MDLATVLGIVLGFSALILAFVLEGGHLSSLIGITAYMIIFGGTFGATMTSYSLKDMLGLPKLIMKAIKTPPDRRAVLVEEIVKLAEIARRDGLLALENQPIEDPFLKKGVMLVVDGTDAELTEQILHADVEAMEQRHARGYSIFQTMGGFAPTMGIIGTVMGLVHVLSSLKDPESLGPAIAVAFLATLYGVATANLLWLPLHNKLKLRSKEEVAEKQLIIEGVLGIQAGENPRMLREKLLVHLPPQARASEQKAAAVGARAMAPGGE